ncbi:perforin-1-like [Megalops cyprinoides]|uniref:perforin-1-like n=1 Tax=Megalops cyprinoides TaxID=118141 RepID=UPI001863E938|nr:perforin-1-like [Megalops cyprinoides]
MLWLLLLSLWAPLLCPSLACTTGGSAECQKAPLVPGSNLAGEGFDVVTMERKRAYLIDVDTWRRARDKTCTLCANPYMENQLQKLPLAVVDWRALPSCRMQVTSTSFQSSEDFANNSQTGVDNSWRVGLELGVPQAQASVILGGSHSRAAKEAMEKSKKDRFSFIRQEFLCSYYSYRLVEHPPLHSEFSRALKRLPPVYNNQSKAEYRRLIHTYGTHFSRKVQLGGSVRSVTALRVCQAALSGYSEEEVKDCLNAEASLTVGIRASVKTEAQHCKHDLQQKHSKQNFHSHFSERSTEVTGGKSGVSDLLFSGVSDPAAFRDWMGSLKDTPDVVTYSLDPMHLLVRRPERKRRGLKKAVEDYILEHALLKRCSARCSGGATPSSHDSCDCVCQPSGQINSHCCPTAPGLARITVTVERAEGLWGDTTDQTDGFVKVAVCGKTTQTTVLYNNNNPAWNEKYDLGDVKLSLASELKLEVWDEDNAWYKRWNDLLGSCKVQPKEGFHKDICPLNHGTLYYSYKVECAPGLSGDTCDKHKPSPMSPSLAELYASRNSLNMTSDLLAQIRKGWPVADPLLSVGKLNRNSSEDHPCLSTPAEP